MTLDEAIEHCEEVSSRLCNVCGQEHKQLAQWLIASSSVILFLLKIHS